MAKVHWILPKSNGIWNGSTWLYRVPNRDFPANFLLRSVAPDFSQKINGSSIQNSLLFSRHESFPKIYYSTSFILDECFSLVHNHHHVFIVGAIFWQEEWSVGKLYTWSPDSESSHSLRGCKGFEHRCGGQMFSRSPGESAHTATWGIQVKGRESLSLSERWNELLMQG